jgi:hypothetical protein
VAGTVHKIIERFFTSRLLPLYLALAGILLTLPALWSGWQQDDLLQRYYLLGNLDPNGEPVPPLNMFAFLDGDSTTIARHRDLGVIPWWTYPRLRLAFLRPLTGLTHWVDYELWPRSAELMHAQSLLWFGALIAAVTLLYRRLQGVTWLAGLAALLFVLDDAHGLPAGWLANRNAVVAACFGVLALVVHDHRRRGTFRAGEKLGPLLFVIGLLSGETALATMAYLVAYALFVDEGSILRRINSLVPYGVAAAFWLVLYRELGFGTQGSGFYVDPYAQPVSYLGALLERGPILLMDQWAFPPSSPYMFIPAEARHILLIWAVLVCLLVGFLLVPLLRKDRYARFWCAGMLLSLPIVAATTPHGRLLIFAGLGGMALLAMWMQGIWERWRMPQEEKDPPVFHRVLLVLFVLIHLIVAPLLLPLNAVSASTTEQWLQKPARMADLGPGIEQKDLILVNPPIVFLANYFIAVRSLEGLPAPQRQRVLAPGNVAVHIERTDPRTLVIRPDGGFLAGPFDDVFRAPSLPLRTGDRIPLTNVEVEILEAGADGRPTAVAFRFAERLEHTSFRWLMWENGEWTTFLPPAVGGTVTLPPAPLLF